LAVDRDFEGAADFPQAGIGQPAESTDEDGVLKQITVGRRNRAFEASELIDSFTALERQLASPDADTLASPPARRVPYRPAR
jgi:hypothetical protein